MKPQELFLSTGMPRCLWHYSEEFVTDVLLKGHRYTNNFSYLSEFDNVHYYTDGNQHPLPQAKAYVYDIADILQRLLIFVMWVDDNTLLK